MKRTKSGEHPAVLALRERQDSFTDGTLPKLDTALERVVEACVEYKRRSDRPETLPAPPDTEPEPA
jgi:hypothetical protein